MARTSFFFRVAARGIAASGLIVAFSADALYRCDVDGRVTYQEGKCSEPPSARPAPRQQAPSPARQPVPRPPIGDPAYEEARAKARASEIDSYAKREGAVLQARRSAQVEACGERIDRKPFVGATLEWVRDCSDWGRPDRIYTAETAFGVTQQWQYSHRASLFFDTKGKLTAIAQ